MANVEIDTLDKKQKVMKWKQDEINQFKSYLRLYGKKWSKYTDLKQTRSPHQIKCFYYNHKAKFQKDLNAYISSQGGQNPHRPDTQNSNQSKRQSNNSSPHLPGEVKEELNIICKQLSKMLNE